MVAANRRFVALAVAILGLGLALYGWQVDAGTKISCPPLPQGDICQDVLVKQIGQSLEILGAIIFVVGLFLFAAWRLKDGTGAVEDLSPVSILQVSGSL